MPAPMPPQGAPGPQDSNSSPGAPPQAQGQDSGGAISTLLTSVSGALNHLNDVIGQSKATNPEEKQLIQQINGAYGKLMDMLGAGGGGDDQSQSDSGAQGQTVPPEAGGNKGAVPAP